MFSYIHIPFCESKCKYCRFASLGSVNQVLVKTYLGHLLQDIHNYKRPDGNNAGLLRSVYFGGGTPSILEMKDLAFIINTLKNKFGFENDIEITLETTPKNITLENILAWEQLGINRISMGIQTLNNRALDEIQRDNKEIILDGLEKLRPPQSPLLRGKLGKSRGIQNISVDFIIGLPYVQKGETLGDIKYILENYPFIKHISVYMLEDYYVGNTDDSNFEKITYPTDWKDLGLKEEDFLGEYLEIKKYLETQGFFKYELSNFAKAGCECKHNQSYWNHEENIGFGLGSHSFVGGKRYAYKDDFLGYYRGELEYEETLSEHDIFLEKVMFGLRTKGLKKEISSKLNQEKINEYIQSGLLERKDEYLVVSNTGIGVIDTIIGEII